MLGIAYENKIRIEAKKAVQSYICGDFPVTERYNDTYTRSKLLDVITYAIANNYFIEESSELLKERRRKTADADTVFYRIKPATVSQVRDYFDRSNHEILITAKSQGLLKEQYVCGLDWHDSELYSKKIKEAVRTEPKNGTDYALRYLSIECVEEKRRFTFHAVPITHLTNLCDAIRQLVIKTKEYVNIKLILMDRGFFAANILGFLLTDDIPYMMPVIRNQKIAKLERAIGLKRLPIINTQDSFYVVPDYLLAKKVNIMIVFYFTPSKDIDRPYECFVFTTNLDVNANNVRELAGLYRKRWGIETGYRLKDKLYCKTCSTSYVARLLLMFLSILFYNFWTLLRILKPPWTKPYKRFTLNKLKKIVRECIEFGG